MNNFFANISKRKIAILCYIQAVIFFANAILDISTPDYSLAASVFEGYGWLSLIINGFFVLLFIIMGHSLSNADAAKSKISGAALLGCEIFVALVATVTSLGLMNEAIDNDIDSQGLFVVIFIIELIYLLAIIATIFSLTREEPIDILNYIITGSFILYALLNFVLFFVVIASGIYFSAAVVLIGECIKAALSVFIYGSLIHSRQEDYLI